MTQERRHAAIMFTDIVGYTALMGSDEDRAFEVLKKNREIHLQNLDKFNGTLIKEIGDGMLLSFDLASNAVRCAVEIQKAAKKDGIPLKIGIHEGEMVFEGNDVLGDSVNIASRLQEGAEENTIHISSSVYKDIRNKSGINTVSIGERSFKNVEEPVKVYKVIVDAEDSPPAPDRKGRSKYKPYFLLTITVVVLAAMVWYFVIQQQSTGPSKANIDPADKSIAVLPFLNMSNDPDQQYFSDGVMEAIRNNLIKIEDLIVISRTSVLQYRNTEKTSPQIAGELGVTYLLEGTVQTSGDKVRISTQLIDAINDRNVWSETYDREMDDIFVIQSEVAQEVAGILEAKIDPEVMERIEAPSTQSVEAYNLYLKAMGELMSERIKLLDQAITLDSNYADAYAQKSYAWLALGGFAGTYESREVISNATSNLTRALEIDPDNDIAHSSMGALQLWYFWNFSESEKSLKTALKLNRSSTLSILNYVDLLQATGRYEEALELVEAGIKVDPSNTTMIGTKGLCQYLNGRPYEALATVESITSVESGTTTDGISGAVALATGYKEAARVFLYLGQHEQVISILSEYFDTFPKRFRSPWPLAEMAIAYLQIGDQEKAQEIIDEIKLKAEESAIGSPSYFLAMIYAQTGETDVAFEWLEKAYNNHEVELYWMKVEPPFDPIREDPRWQEMLDRVGFPK